MKRIVLVAGLALASVAAPAPALAEPRDLQMRMGRDAAITAAAATTWLTLEIFRNSFLDTSCRWCDTGGGGAEALNGFDRGMRSKLVWSNTAAAGTASNVALYGGALAATMGLGALSATLDGRSGNLGADTMIMAQSTFMALAVNNAAKLAFQRQRPYAHAAAMSGSRLTRISDSDNLSFFSGHTTLAFSVAVSAGTIASMRDYKLAPVIWGVGLTSAAATGYLRIAADKHYVTDVLVGAAVGSAFGFAVPYFMHGKGSSDGADEGLGLAGAPVKGGGILSFSGVW
jgi:membrane-associated phospholipid phosphatase